MFPMQHKTNEDWGKALERNPVHHRHAFVFQASSSLQWIKRNESQMSQWDVVLGRLAPSPHWGGGSHNADYTTPSTPPPPKQIKCLIQTRPLSAPQTQPLSGPRGTMPTVIRRQHRWSHTETSRVQLLHPELLQLWHRTCWRVDTEGEHGHWQCRRQAKCRNVQ